MTDGLARFGPLRFELDCLGRRHELVWEAGEVRALDHDDEPEGVLAALGAAAPPCMALVSLSRAPLEGSGTRALLTGNASAEDLVRAAELNERHISRLARDPESVRRLHWMTGHLRRLAVAAQAPVGVRTLIQLDRAFRAPQLPARGRDAEIRRLVAVAVRETAPDPDVALRVDVVRETKTAHAYGWSSEGSTAAALYVQPSWVKVAEEGAAVVDGHLMVRLNRPTTRRARTGQAVRWEPTDGGLFAAIRRCSVTGGDGGSLRWL
ncbi:MAG TPA: hypothetical protein VM840_13275 [Actinomycetota bacterium]|nr:hypothetical protein [Actinomycetota bacterium]